MGVYQRADSPYWWMHVETAPTGRQKRSTDVHIGVTATERKASREEAQAVHHAAELKGGQVRNGRPTTADPLTFKAFSVWYATHEIPQHRGAYRERQILPRLVAAFGSLQLSEVTAEAVIEWRTVRLKTPTKVQHYGGPKGKAHTFPAPSARTVNREVGLLQQILTAAVEAGHIAVSPLVGLADLPAGPIRRRTMGLDEEARLLPVLAVDDRAILLVGLDALVRLGDILDLRRVDDRGDQLEIRNPKNGEPLSVPISARLRVALDAVEVDPKQAEWYFPRRRQAKTEQARSRGYIKALARACRDATPPIPYGRAEHGVTFHWGTRRTGATRMIRAGGEKVLGVVQQIGGWKNVGVLIGIYQETITEDMRAAVETVSSPKRSRARLTRVK